MLLSAKPLFLSCVSRAAGSGGGSSSLSSSSFFCSTFDDYTALYDTRYPSYPKYYALLNLVGPRPIDTRSANRVSSFLASSQTLHTVGLQTEMRNTYTHTRCNAYARQRPRDYIETVVNFNFVHPLGPRGNLRSRNAPLVQRTCMSKDTRERETGLMKNCRYY